MAVILHEARLQTLPESSEPLPTAAMRFGCCLAVLADAVKEQRYHYARFSLSRNHACFMRAWSEVCPCLRPVLQVPVEGPYPLCSLALEF